MRAFAELYFTIDATTKTNAKVDAMVDYFGRASSADAAWALYILSGRKEKQLISSKHLRLWSQELTGIFGDLFEDSYAAVGDLAETITLLIDGARPPVDTFADPGLAAFIEQRLLPLRSMNEADKRKAILSMWQSMDPASLFMANKLLTGSLRVGVSQKLVVRALSRALAVEENLMQERLMGHWRPTPSFFASLAGPDGADRPRSRPYPFYLAHPLQHPSELGETDAWLAEWKWDGIRGQLIVRDGEVYLWSRGEELVNDAFPDLIAAALQLPDGVYDGEILVLRDDKPAPFAALQKRLGRKNPSKKILAEHPAGYFVYDLLERDGVDLREESFARRRALLEKSIAFASPFFVSPLVPFDTFAALDDERQRARDVGAEGVVLKHADGTYKAGRRRGEWWKWKADPMSLDTVLMYANAGHGRRANLFTDYTLGVWDDGELVPIAKAYSGLTDQEIDEIDRWIKRHTEERFGPVRKVEPKLVLEIAFEGIQASSRHKSGIALRFPRIHRWRRDKLAKEADQLATARALLEANRPL